jgi:methylenetetrahydrofolate dehydrogenase (NADP+) / methenyltetrahydrofolate cyclohydrolase
MVIDGRKIAGEIMERLKLLPQPKKFFAAFLVGDDASSISFLKQKGRAAKTLGVDFRLYTLPSEIKNDELRDEVRKVAEHTTCGGVVVQLPLPAHLNPQYILNVIPREKDIDVLGERALGAFYADRNPVRPPAVEVVEEILRATNFDLSKAKVAVVGLGPLVGKPISMWLMRQVRELRLLDSKSNINEMLKDVDLVITGVGRAGLIKPETLKAGAAVIDFGYDGNKGDFDSEPLPGSRVAPSFYTPTPGGTGPILVAKVFENFYTLNK